MRVGPVLTGAREETATDPLSPREIQARVRAGASVAEIADETGWPLDKVERYAGPPLAERAYIAERAQQVEVRRTGGIVLLRDAVALVLKDQATAVQWDAMRRDDGRWIVVAVLPTSVDRSSASWTYDPAGPNLHPLDEPARWLLGVSDEPIIDYITDVAPQDEAVEEARPRLVALPDLEEVDGDADDLDVDGDDVEVDLTADVTDAPPSPAPSTTAGHEQTSISIPDELAPKARAAKPKPAVKPKAKGRRASVPSWDEILFGASRGDDA